VLLPEVEAFNIIKARTRSSIGATVPSIGTKAARAARAFPASTRAVTP
jgi:hypothetical protein